MSAETPLTAARPPVGRFAPSPTGPLHFGSLVAALASYCDARAQGGRWLVRIEDVDEPRSRASAERAILATLLRYGFRWDGDAVRQSDRTPHYVVAAVWLVVSIAYVVAMPRWRYRVHRWEATPHAIYTQIGWFNQERRIAPLSRVQTVDLKRGPIAQLFRLASVTVTTASAAGPLEIVGLDLNVARDLVDALTTAAVVEKGDAT